MQRLCTVQPCEEQHDIAGYLTLYLRSSSTELAT